MAEEGEAFVDARQRASAHITGDAGARAALPDRQQVEAALREHLRNTEGEQYAERLKALRLHALEWMQRLARFEPHLVGAVLNGSATRHAHLHLHLFADSAKDVEMFLLDQGVDIGVDAPQGDDARAQECIGFLDTARSAGGPARAAATGILLTVYDLGALRVAPPARLRPVDPALHPVERSGRANLAMVRALLDYGTQHLCQPGGAAAAYDGLPR